MHRSHVFCTTTSHFSWYTVLCCFCPSHVSTSSVLPEGRKLCISLTFLTICTITSHVPDIQCCVASVMIICVRTMCFLLFFCNSRCLVDTRDRFIHPFSWNYIVKVYLLTTFDKDRFTIIYLQRSNCVR